MSEEKKIPDGKKNDSGKRRWGLLPWEEVGMIVDVLMVGAKKYTQEIELNLSDSILFLLKELEICPNVNIAIKKFTRLECADVITKNICRREILIIKKGKEKIVLNGNGIIKNGEENTKKEEIKIPKEREDIMNLADNLFLGNMDCLPKMANYYYGNKEIDALYVEEVLKNTKCIWIMMIEQKRQEDIYVVNAITDLDFLEITLKVLKKQFNILKNVQLKNSLTNSFNFLIYGNENWKLVEDGKRRYYEALIRHVTAWWCGESCDKDDGLHHLAHAGCCLLFLLWIDKNGEKK